MRLILDVDLLSGVSRLPLRAVLAASLLVSVLPAAALADEGGDVMDRPDQLRIINNGDTPTSVDAYESPLFAPTVAPANDLTLPPDLNTLLNTNVSAEDGKKKAAAKIRMDALRESALSFGARGGLARRTWEIRQTLDRTATDMDRAFNFRTLLIAAPSGFLIEPPVVTEAEKNVIISNDGQQAAVSDTILKIGREARIVSAARDWRTYLERDWGKVEPPPAVLMPKTEEEKIQWSKWVAQGWEEGYKQATEIFQADIDRMTRDYTGMVRYRWLLAQNMISAPFALQEDRGITGGGGEMRIGDRAVSITGQPELRPGSDKWQAVPR